MCPSQWAQPLQRTHQWINEKYNRETGECVQVNGPNHYSEPINGSMRNATGRTVNVSKSMGPTITANPSMDQWEMQQAEQWMCPSQWAPPLQWTHQWINEKYNRETGECVQVNGPNHYSEPINGSMRNATGRTVNVSKSMGPTITANPSMDQCEMQQAEQWMCPSQWAPPLQWTHQWINTKYNRETGECVQVNGPNHYSEPINGSMRNATGRTVNVSKSMGPTITANPSMDQWKMQQAEQLMCPSQWAHP